MTPDPPPRASLVVLNYNGRELLDWALPSFLAQNAEEDFEVVVVDNGSSDGSVAHLVDRWPQVRVVALPENVGVTAALNAMVRAARGELIALLNNDVELEPDWLTTLATTLDHHPEAAAAAGKLLSRRDRTVIDRAGDRLRWSGACHGRGAGETDRGQYDRAEEVFAVGGAAALYRRSAIERVGPFDEAFFAYLEDVDWGFRARLAGYTARYEPSAVGWHEGGATLGTVNAFSLYHLRRNQVWLVVKNYPARSLVRHGAAVLVFTLHAAAMAVRRRQAGLVARAYRDALRDLPGVLAKRRAIQQGRAVTQQALDAVIEPAGVPW